MKKHVKLLSVLGILSLILTGCKFVTNSSSDTSREDSSDSSSISMPDPSIDPSVPPSSSDEPSSSSEHQSSSSEQESSSSSSSSSKEPEKYTIIWQNYDGTVLETDENILEGTMPTYDGLTPVREEDAQYSYSWTGWSPEVEPAKASTIYTATFIEEIKKYTIVWKDEDGTVLETDIDVPHGTTPEFNKADPTKESTEQHTYSFDGWSPEVTTVTGDATYTATYKEELRKYTITWKNYDDTVLASEDVAYGEVPSYKGDTPAKPSTQKYQYAFDGWTPNVVAVTGEATYTATFTEEIRTYTITWVNYDGTVLEVDENVQYAAIPTYDGATPTKEGTRGINYVWKGWTPSIVPVYRDEVYTAKYNEQAFFSFDLIDYELEDGYELSDLKGAPWINLNYAGEINKIKQPSLKDDFYSAVNYQPMKDGEKGPFEIGDQHIKEALSKVYDQPDSTRNGYFLNAFLSKMVSGSADEVGSYFRNLDVENYMTSKDSFNSLSSYVELIKDNDGYEVQFNDGYIDEKYETYGMNGLIFYSYFNNYSHLDSPVNNIINTLFGAFGMSLTAQEKNNIFTLERNLAFTVYNDYDTSSRGYTTYTVNSLPWPELKSALLDAGLSTSSPVKIRDYFINALTYLYGTYFASYSSLMKKALAIRVGFDYRYLLGLSNYRTINSAMNSTQIMPYERGYDQLDDENLVRYLAHYVITGVVEQCYLELEGDPARKEVISNLIENILDGYENILSNSDWLSQTTREGVVNKLQNMRYESCYADSYMNLPQIDTTNLNSASLFDLYQRYSSTLHDQTVSAPYVTALDYTWRTNESYTANANYHVYRNRFVILNGITPGFTSNITEELFGLMGFVVGHEITHAFDSTGSQYDEYGENHDLFTSSDRSKFDNKVKKMSNFYNNIYLYPGQTVDGNNVNTEATADMGGIKVMLELAKNIPDFNYDAFFRAAARAWLRKPISAARISDYLTDVHPFAYLRVNVTLAQFDEFVNTYDIGPGDGMYIPEDQRVKIW